ncbi:YlbL family protein [Xylanimonas sp. McL0601]|uniref:YlbL family protein n=1 Tax=Xylanimonas sp. McL0601 TaxID=3414739 RepID=UPI003CEEE0F6
MTSTEPRSRVLSGSLLATAALAAAAMVLPTGFAVRGPGPTEDTLGSQNKVPLVEIKGARTYPPSGELRLTTVSVGGGPVSDVFAADVLAAWSSPQRAVLPVETVFPVGITQQQQQEQGQAQMTSSQESATAAALTELGYTVRVTLTISGAPSGSPAEGIVKEGDVIRTLDGSDITTYDDLLSGLAAVTPGDDVVLGVDRDGARKNLTVTTRDGTTPDGGRRAALGVLVSSAYDFPVDVSIRIEDIGGPSAGMMFALAIIDRLTPEDELRGQVVAGTGTIDVDGTVGPIGGIEQKMHGALRDGATWFLAPESNCDEVVGAVPAGLHVAKVSTLAEARHAITAIGAGDGATLPTCS